MTKLGRRLPMITVLIIFKPSLKVVFEGQIVGGLSYFVRETIPVIGVTEKTVLPNTLRLNGTSQSPLVVALVVLLPLSLRPMNSFSGGGASPFRTLKMRQASANCLKLSKLNKLYF